MTTTDEERINFFTKSPFEPLRGYSRAVRVGDHLYISGTTSMSDSGEVIGVGDAYEQTRCVLTKVRTILAQAGFVLNDVVRTRMYVTNISRWEDFARAHREAFELIRPASVIVQVQKLVDPRLLLELEAEAIKGYTRAKNVWINF